MNPPCKMTEDVGVTGYKAPEVAACDKEGKSIVLTSGPQLGVQSGGLKLLADFRWRV